MRTTHCSPHRPVPVVLALIALLFAGTLAGCTSDERGDGSGKRDRIDLDPRRWFDHYEEDRGDGGARTGIVTSESSADGSVGAPEPPAPIPPPSIHEDNTFVDPGENGSVAVADQPRSTFGLDVDTGSPTVARTFLTEGSLPPPESVRVEEWVNALGSAQAVPDDGDLGVEVDGARSPFDEGRRILRVGVAAREVPAADRPPAHVTFVIDTSGSMDIRERLGLVQSSLGLLVLNLRDDDTISIVTYSDDAGVVLEPTPVRDAGRIVEAIDSLRPGSSTNLEAGLRAGYAQAESTFDPDGINAVVLASDGVANVGLTDPNGLAGTIQERAQEGIHLVTVGYGMGNYNDHLMEQVADRGDGFHAYLDTYEQAERLFGDRLTSLLTVVATDAKAQVRFDPAQVRSYRLLGYENRALTDEQFEDDATDAGEVGAGHRVTALYEVDLADGADARSDAVAATAVVRYRSVASGEVVTVEQPVTVGALDAAATAAPADLRLQAAVAELAWLLAGPDRLQEPDALATAWRVAASAAPDLPAEGLPGSVLTPAEALELFDLVGSHAGVPGPGPEPEPVPTTTIPGPTTTTPAPTTTTTAVPGPGPTTTEPAPPTTVEVPPTTVAEPPLTSTTRPGSEG